MLDTSRAKMANVMIIGTTNQRRNKEIPMSSEKESTVLLAPWCKGRLRVEGNTAVTKIIAVNASSVFVSGCTNLEDLVCDSAEVIEAFNCGKLISLYAPTAKKVFTSILECDIHIPDDCSVIIRD
jgi:hypothetical protein